MEVKRTEVPAANENLGRLPALFIMGVALAVKGALIWFALLNAGIGLGPDEAQYWTWSQQLAFGYYSKPPAIAWQIAAGTSLFGNTEVGVRFGALLIGTALPLATYALARAALLSRAAAVWAAMVMAWSPVGVMASFLAITDGGMVLLWAVASTLAVQTLAQQSPPRYYLLGLCIAGGALYKWVMYEFWIVPLALAPFLPAWRSWHLIGGIAVSLLGLLPSVVWNASHDWATFRHVGATIWTRETADAGTTGLIKGNFLDFLGAQAILLSPILFLLFAVGIWTLWKRRHAVKGAVLLCGGLSAGLLAFYLLAAFFKKMQGNWADAAFPAAAVVIAWRAWDNSRRLRPWLAGGIALSALLCAFAMAVPFLQEESLLAIPYKANPFRHNVGWDNLALELKAAGYDPSRHFLAADKYQTASILSFYGPGQKRAYFMNVHGIRKNQFSYWPGMGEEQAGNTAYFVVADNIPLGDPKWEELQKSTEGLLAPYFSDVRFLGVRPLFYANGRPVKGAMLFKGVRYNGKEPGEAALY